MEAIFRVMLILIPLVGIRSMPASTTEDLTTTEATSITVAPTTNDAQEIGKMASQACQSDSANRRKRSTATGNDDVTLLIILQQEIAELKDLAQKNVTVLHPWVASIETSSIYPDFYKALEGCLLVKLGQHSGLSAEENSRLHVLLQLTGFAYYLKEQAGDSAYEPNGASLTNLRSKVMKSACYLRQLLTQVSDQNISTFALDDASSYRYPISESWSANLRRSATYVVIDILLQTLQRLEVSTETRSVVLPDAA